MQQEIVQLRQKIAAMEHQQEALEYDIEKSATQWEQCS
jgi:hypothetical protein